MIIVRTIAECRAARAGLGRLALVPTMGALHEGHLSLVSAARRHAPAVAVSIFVNPTQFGPREDFNRYPRPIEQDLALCQDQGVDLVFNPSPEEMYPPTAAEMQVELPSLSSVLEGKHRPGHFSGVCQVVAKLFNIVQPEVACFGQKDFQQLRILTAMVEALNFPIQMIPCPTLREPDGLAMSSRNRYLAPDERQRALAISRGLFAAAREVAAGVRQTNRLITLIQKTLLEQHLLIDYVDAVDVLTLRHVDLVEKPVALVVAVRVGQTRLIDNLIVSIAP